MLGGLEEKLGKILGSFPIDVDSTDRVDLGGRRIIKKIYKINLDSPLLPKTHGFEALYTLDTPSGKAVACHPHLVGAPLEKLSLESAQEFRAAAEGLGLFNEGSTAILHVLRGGSGYQLAEAFPSGIPILNIRTEYFEDGYRAHSDSGKKIRIAFNDHPDVHDLDGRSTLIVPDTFATGRSAEAALTELFESGLTLDRVVLYGFTAIPALVRVGAVCSEYGAGVHSFSICDLTQLASNNYDMPLYGVDESLHSSSGEFRGLGSVVDRETLLSLLPRYVAGMDQPGDWSERQGTLFTGAGYVEGDIPGHLRRSASLIESLRKINRSQPVYDADHDGIAVKELERIRSTLEKYE
jgi:hypothetical protein